LFLLLIIPLANLGGASPVGAQVVRGVLVDEETRNPIEGAAIILEAEDGSRIGWRFSDGAGRFHFVVGQPGTLRIRAERIGHAAVESELLTLAGTDTVVVRLVAPNEPVLLEGITVGGSRRCDVRPEEGLATATVWEEARKALEATRQTERSSVFRYVIRRVERRLDTRTYRIRDEQSRVDSRFLARPFRSLPADELINEGFVRLDDGGAEFFAPNADVLLSDDFLDTHCFGLIDGPSDGEAVVGLRFEPVKDRGVPDISGTIWVSTTDGHLESLDFKYAHLDILGADDLGGSVIFGGLPDGRWIIREWSIRMPITGMRPQADGHPSQELVALSEVGRQVLRVHEAGGKLVFRTETSAISGTLLDESQQESVSDVVIRLDDALEATTDSLGHFAFADVPVGLHSVRVAAPGLESLGFSPSAIVVETQKGEVTAVQLRHRTPAQELLSICENGETAQSGGILAGRLRDESGEAVAAGEVSVRWTEFRRFASGGMVSDNTGFATQTDRNGFFVLCGLPVETGLAVRAVGVSGSSPADSVRFERSQEVVQRSFVLSEESEERGVDPSQEDLEGLSGIVTDAGSGTPISGALVELPALGRSTSTDATGRFTIPSLQPGEYRIRIDQLGFASADFVTEFDGSLRLSISLAPVPIEIEGITVEAESSLISERLIQNGFARRAQEGFGRFIAPGEIEKRQGMSIGSLLGRTGLVKTSLSRNNGRADEIIRMWEPGGGYCTPMIYLDGNPFNFGGMTLDDIVPVPSLEAAEVYRSKTEAPARFGGGRGECGVIVLWTKLR